MRNKHEIVELIEGLDLVKIKGKLISDKGWTKEEADTVEIWYKRFLILHAKYPGQKHVPNKAIDSMWHEHILNTRKYAADCENIFGEFMHHNPSYDEKNQQKMQDVFTETNKYYRIEFGEDCTTMFGLVSPELLKVKNLDQSECTNCDD